MLSQCRFKARHAVRVTCGVMGAVSAFLRATQVASVSRPCRNLSTRHGPQDVPVRADARCYTRSAIRLPMLTVPTRVRPFSMMSPVR